MGRGGIERSWHGDDNPRAMGGGKSATHQIEEARKETQTTDEKSRPTPRSPKRVMRSRESPTTGPVVNENSREMPVSAPPKV